MLTIGTQTQVCAVVGNPVSHSLSPAIHNAGFRALGLDFVYVAFRVEDINGALTGMRSLENFRGFSITIPHKVDAMKYVDDVAERDRRIGSINTVVSEKGRLKGLGTDGPGALRAIEDAGVTAADKTVLMLGAGGAARAIAFTLADSVRMNELIMMDVDRAVLSELTSDVKAGTTVPVTSAVFSDEALKGAMDRSDLIIHCTPVGMHPRTEASLVPPALFRKGQTVFDIVYNPLETKLLSDARGRGLRTISGVEMFVNQAVLQFERFTGCDAPKDVMRRVVLERLTA